jgi:hypothetical protein
MEGTKMNYLAPLVEKKASLKGVVKLTRRSGLNWLMTSVCDVKRIVSWQLRMQMTALQFPRRSTVQS